MLLLEMQVKVQQVQIVVVVVVVAVAVIVAIIVGHRLDHVLGLVDGPVVHRNVPQRRDFNRPTITSSTTTVAKKEGMEKVGTHPTQQAQRQEQQVLEPLEVLVVMIAVHRPGHHHNQGRSREGRGV